MTIKWIVGLIFAASLSYAQAPVQGGITQPGGGGGTVTGVTAGSGLSGGGTTGTVTVSGTIACAGTPGNTTLTYRQSCSVTSTGAVYICNNAAGCTVAADVVAVGTAGAVTVVGSGTLTSTDCVTGGGSQTIQTPSANCTVDSSGNVTVNSLAASSDGVHAGYVDLIGNTTNPAIGPNTAGWLGPNLATFTAYGLQMPSSGPTGANQVLLFGALSGAVSIGSFGTVPNAALTNSSTTVQSQTCALGATCTLAPPQVTVLTSGSGTYTTPTNAAYLQVELCGGGGGGSGSGTFVSGGSGSNGVATTFGTSLLTGNPGSGGPFANGTTDLGGAGGTATGGDFNISGGPGEGLSAIGGQNIPGGSGGNTVFGGAGTSAGFAQTGRAASANSCAGGYGGGISAVGQAGSGGGAGGYAKKLITSPLSSYAYTVGTGGAGGTAQTSGIVGGAGASGIIIVTAYFQ